MSEQDDDVQGFVFGVVGFIVLGVVALVVGLSVWQLNRIGAAQSAAAPMMVMDGEAERIANGLSDIAPVGAPLARVYFDLGGTELSPADQPAIDATVAALQGRDDVIVLLSGFHDESGDAIVNAEIARQRALSVRDALIAQGVAPERIKLRKPESTLGTGTAAESRRVEIRVQ
jgi:outer membrane protein OmpA-like peptidoglycan-associated protein